MPRPGILSWWRCPAGSSAARMVCEAPKQASRNANAPCLHALNEMLARAGRQLRIPVTAITLAVNCWENLSNTRQDLGELSACPGRAGNAFLAFSNSISVPHWKKPPGDASRTLMSLVPLPWAGGKGEDWGGFS